MCFRPPQAQKPTKCPQCGAMNPAQKKNCVKCQADLTITQINAANWFEIPVADLLKAKKFYESVFGYSLTTKQINNLNMAMFPLQAGSQGASGALVKADNYTPSNVGATVYLTVNDIEMTLSKITTNGGKVILPRTAMDNLGFIGQFEDCEGNRVGLYSQK